jgi:hypothetical protein
MRASAFTSRCSPAHVSARRLIDPDPLAMRILHAMHSMSPESGGPAEAVRRLAHTASPADVYEAEFVTLDAQDSPYRRTESIAIHAIGRGRGKYGYTRDLDRWLDET